MDTFIQAVRLEQRQLGMNQTEFARLLGLDPSTISYFHGGRRSKQVAARVGLMFDDLRDAALLFLSEEVPEHTYQGQSDTTESPAAPPESL